ncbi:MAG TPA: outer membrane beta-barrel protein [Candidatus Angelobacter sp.]|nr:outer membrane beta-barrel protein [Candidatus Angelobacter sp.]
MTKSIIATIAVSVSGLCAASAQQYVYPVPPPPPPPPPAYPTSPAPVFVYVLPPDAGPYANFAVGPTFYQNGELKSFGSSASGTVHYNVGASGDAAIGYAFNRYVAAGIEFGVNTTTIESIPGYVLNDAQIYNIPFLANITFTYPIPHSLITPYIGGGVGGSDSVFNPTSMSDVNFRNTVTGEEDNVVFAWEIYAGLRFQLAPNMTLGIGYKYFGTGNPNFSYPSYPPAPNFNVGFQGVETHSILVSFNLRF